MRIGIQQNAISPFNLHHSMAVARKAGAEGIGVNVPTMRSVIELGRQGYADNLRAMAREYDLELTNLHLGALGEEPSLIGRDRDMSGGKAIVRLGVWTAAEAGIGVVVVPFFGRNRIEFPHEQRRAEHALADLAEEAQHVGVTLAVEADLVPEQHRDLVEAPASEHVKAAINTGHIVGRRLDVAGMARDLGASLVHQVQLKDVVLIPHTPPQYNVRLGRGNVDFGSLFRALQLIGFKGWLNVDAPPGDEDGIIAAANVRFVRGLISGQDWLASKRARMTRFMPAEELQPA